jgi:hypothetical protein
MYIFADLGKGVCLLHMYVHLVLNQMCDRFHKENCKMRYLRHQDGLAHSLCKSTSSLVVILLFYFFKFRIVNDAILLRNSSQVPKNVQNVRV